MIITDWFAPTEDHKQQLDLLIPRRIHGPNPRLYLTACDVRRNRCCPQVEQEKVWVYISSNRLATSDRVSSWQIINVQLRRIIWSQLQISQFELDFILKLSRQFLSIWE